MRRYLSIWVVLSALACAVVYMRSTLTLGPVPDAASVHFAYAALAAARGAESLPEPPDSARRYRADPIFVTAYVAGERRARHVGHGSLADVVLAAARRFATDPALPPAIAATAPGRRDRVMFRVAVTRASGPLLSLIPGLSLFSLVPLRDGVMAQRAGRTAYLTPDDLVENAATDQAVIGVVPDLSFGTSLDSVRELLAAELGLGQEAPLDSSWQLRRLRVEALAAKTTGEPRGDVQTLRRAAHDGVRFVLRHQATSGRFTYIYDAARDQELPGPAYNLARHAGTMFFLARAAKQLGLPEARAGALRGLSFVRDNALMTCGGPDRLCVDQRDRVEFGASALMALACAEILRSGDDPDARRLLTGLVAFLLAQQRPDGEMMHEYSREREAPVDVQRMYYSGEAAMALLHAYDQLGDASLLRAAARLMSHLTGAGWSFFGARYYYGEEHWTCQAVAKAAEHLQVDAALDFCLRWGRWQEHLQYPAGVTPWPIDGAFGVGPVLLPRATMAASRVEALVPLYRELVRRGRAVASTRVLIERSLGFLLRTRWAPGPVHLFGNPSAAFGGMPSTGAELRSRVDMVQHSGGAFLAWADALSLGY